jgi:hypothetical protein
MPTVVVETGAGLTNANSYCTVAEADVYHTTHLYPRAWDEATSDQKERAVIWATRLLDEQCKWRGERSSTAQALRWPRVNVLTQDGDNWESSSTIPTWLRDATAECARALIEKNRPMIAEDQQESARTVAGKSVSQGRKDGRWRAILPVSVMSMVNSATRAGDAALVRTS